MLEQILLEKVQARDETPTFFFGDAFSAKPALISRVSPSFAVDKTTFVTVLVTPSTDLMTPSNFSSAPVLAAFTFKIKLSSPVT